MRRIFPILAVAVLAVLIPKPALAQRWVAIDVGFGHGCALDEQGRAFCWGINYTRELGAPTPETCGHAHHPGERRCHPSRSEVPLAVVGGRRFRSISAGGYRTCALDAEGRAFCWGKDIDAPRDGCAPGGACGFAPVPFAPGTVFRSIRLAEDAICGILQSGEGRCWRRPFNTVGVWREEAVFRGGRLAALDRYADWPDPDDHISCAVTEDGRALCQGSPNNLGQLGRGDTIADPAPKPVASRVRFADIRPHEGWTCGLTGVGQAYCWGIAAPRPSWPGGSPPEPEFFACTYSAWCSGPIPRAGGLRFTSLAWRTDSACGLTPGGEVHCWDWRWNSVPRRIAPGVRFRAIDGGPTILCGIARDGAIYCVDHEDEAGKAVRVPSPAR